MPWDGASSLRRQRSRVFWGEMERRDRDGVSTAPTTTTTTTTSSGSNTLRSRTDHHRHHQAQDSGFSDSDSSLERQPRVTSTPCPDDDASCDPAAQLLGPEEADHRDECLEDFLFVPDDASAEALWPQGPRRGPLDAWLEELRQPAGAHQEEDWLALESKRLPGRPRPGAAAVSATAAATRLLHKASRLDRLFEDQLARNRHRSCSGATEAGLRRLEREAAELLGELSAEAATCASRPDLPPTQRLIRLRSTLDRAIDARLDFFVERVLQALADGPSEGARGALAALTALGLAGPRAGGSVARCSGVRALLRAPAQLRALSLRALASLCCSLEALESFLAEGGPATLARLLGDEGASLAERTEAAALVVQIASPWMGRAGLAHLEPLAPSLLPGLAALAERAACAQTLLLAAAALNYLAESARCRQLLLRTRALPALLRSVKRLSSAGTGTTTSSLCLMEQVAQLIGRLAREPGARRWLAEARASVALVCFLRMQPPELLDPDDPGDETCPRSSRLVESALEALTRLCVDPDIARQVVAVGGADYLAVPRQGHQNDHDAGDGDEQSRLDRDPGAMPTTACSRFLKNTKSLRAARRIAAEHLDIAKICDSGYRLGDSQG